MSALPILFVVVVAGYFDVRWRRVPNWLTASTLVTALVWHGMSAGASGLRGSVAGAALALGLLFPLFLIRALGAGDVKFAAAIGAAVTARFVPPFLLLTIVVSACIAAVEVARRGAVRRTIRNVGILTRGWARGRFGPHRAISIDNPDAIFIPFTLSAAAATWLTLLFGRS